MSHITQGGVVGKCWGFKKCSVLFELQINTIYILNLNETRSKTIKIALPNIPRVVHKWLQSLRGGSKFCDESSQLFVLKSLKMCVWGGGEVSNFFQTFLTFFMDDPLADSLSMVNILQCWPTYGGQICYNMVKGWL